MDALIADVQGEPGGLPLLSTSLLESFPRGSTRATARTLRLSAYSQAVGVHGAVARLAERAFGRLDPGHRYIARRLLLRLAGGGERDMVVRRRVPLAELEVERREEVAEVLSALAQDRLITISDGDVEVAHEALLREWPRLRGWLEEDAEGLVGCSSTCAPPRARGGAGGRDRGELYRGARLASTLDGRETMRLTSTTSSAPSSTRPTCERALAASPAGRTGGCGLLLVLAVIAGLVAFEQRGNARDQALTAAAERRSAHRRWPRTTSTRSLLLARQGVTLDDSLQTRSDLLAALLEQPRGHRARCAAMAIG